MIKLEVPLCAVDTETTGPHPKVDRIIEFGVVKVYPDGERTEWGTLINPECRIPSEATAIHGITDEMVKDQPTWKEVAPRIAGGLKGCDILAYSADFDMKFITAEYERLGVRVFTENCRIIDPLDIYRHFFPRDLTSAVREYLGEGHSGAHRAQADALAALRVFEAQVERYAGKIPDTVEGLHKQFRDTPRDGHVDSDGKLYWRFNEACLNFSDHAGESLRTVDRGFLRWILGKDFPPRFKTIIQAAMGGKYPEKLE